MCQIARDALMKPALPHWSWASILLLCIAGGALWYGIFELLAKVF